MRACKQVCHARTHARTHTHTHTHTGAGGGPGPVGVVRGGCRSVKARSSVQRQDVGLVQPRRVRHARGVMRVRVCIHVRVCVSVCVCQSSIRVCVCVCVCVCNWCLLFSQPFRLPVIQDACQKLYHAHCDVMCACVRGQGAHGGMHRVPVIEKTEKRVPRS